MSEENIPSNPPAGWYPNPEGDSSKQRYWDGNAWTTQLRPAAAPAAGLPGMYSDKSPHDVVLMIVLCVIGFFGVAGIHRFVAGKIGTGVLMLITGGGCGIWTIIDLILIASRNFRDSDGRLVG